nr:MAG TPA: hypothetical protein [Bacteriophage sp.]
MLDNIELMFYNGHIATGNVWEFGGLQNGRG